MRARRPPHPLEHHPSFRAVIAAAPALAELATRLQARERERARAQPPPRGGGDGEVRHTPTAPTELARIAGRPDGADLVGALAIACGDLADGFAAPPESRRRLNAHHRAWIAVREIDRAVTAAARRRLAPPEIVKRAQRAIDRADVLIGALLPA